MLSDVFITEREQKRDFLLKFNGMHECCHMSWEDCAAVYEAETQERISGDALRLKVKRAVENAGFVRITEFPEKIVVSVQELTLHGCVWCAIRKFFTRLFGSMGKKKG